MCVCVCDSYTATLTAGTAGNTPTNATTLDAGTACSKLGSVSSKVEKQMLIHTQFSTYSCRHLFIPDNADGTCVIPHNTRYKVPNLLQIST